MWGQIEIDDVHRGERFERPDGGRFRALENAREVAAGSRRVVTVRSCLLGDRPDVVDVVQVPGTPVTILASGARL
jgi:hypothetical protein